MPVLLADRALRVRARSHPLTRDARGVPVPVADDTITETGPFPGSAKEQPDTSWHLRLDERHWPVRAGDEVTDGTLTWIVQTDPRKHGVPGIPDVDYIDAVGTLDPPRVP